MCKVYTNHLIKTALATRRDGPLRIFTNGGALSGDFGRVDAGGNAEVTAKSAAEGVDAGIAEDLRRLRDGHPVLRKQHFRRVHAFAQIIVADRGVCRLAVEIGEVTVIVSQRVSRFS